MPPLRVVEAVNVVADRHRRVRMRLVSIVIEKLGPQRREEAFCDGVVPAVACATHAGDDAGRRSAELLWIIEIYGVLVARLPDHDGDSRRSHRAVVEHRGSNKPLL